MYGNFIRDQLKEIYREKIPNSIKLDEEAQELFRTGILVSLGYLIDQLENGERKKDGIKAAAGDLQEHIKILFEKKKEPVPDIIKELNRQLRILIDAPEKFETKYLPTLRRAFAIFDAENREKYDAAVRANESDYAEAFSEDSELGNKIKDKSAAGNGYGTRTGTDMYIEVYSIANPEATTSAQAEAETAQESASAPATGGAPVYVKVTPKGGKKFEAKVVVWKYTADGAKLNTE